MKTTTRKTFTIPHNELTALERAKEKVMRAGGDLANDSYVIRVGLQAILELDRGRLEACVSKCPHLKSGREPTKERKQMTRDKMEALFGLRT